MARKRRLKITPILVTLNILVLLIIVGFYVTRLVKYYIKEQGSPTDEGPTLLVDTIIKKQSYMDLTKGLVYDEEKLIYTYKGDVKDNYLLYSGMLYRIIGIDEKNNIRAVSEDVVTMIYSGLEKGYADSYVNKWLNTQENVTGSGVYESNLYKTELLANTKVCTDVIDNLTNITCEESNFDNKIAILSLNDYKIAGGKTSFLNNGESYYLINNDSNDHNYYVAKDGEIGISKLPTRIGGVRPVITIDNNTELIEGNGKKDSPYIIEKHDIKTLKDVYIGNYIKYNDEIFKVVNLDENSTKVAATKVLENENGEVIVKKYGSASNYSTDKNTLGQYLNSDYINSLKNNKEIVDGDWGTGRLSLSALDYATATSSTFKAKIGMLGLGDFYIQDIYNVFTITRGIESSKVVMVITDTGSIYSDSVTSEYAVRVAFNLDASTKITGGSGTKESPYELGVIKDEEKKEE